MNEKTMKAIELLQKFQKIYFETGMDEKETANLAVEITNFLANVGNINLEKMTSIN